MKDTVALRLGLGLELGSGVGSGFRLGGYPWYRAEAICASQYQVAPR